MASDLGYRIANRAEEWIGTPYKDKGQGRSGVDCANFCGAVYREEGVVTRLPRFNYDRGYWKRTPWLIREAVDRTIEFLADGYEVQRFVDPDDDFEYKCGDLLLVAQRKKIEAITHAVLLFDRMPHGWDIIHARQGSGSMPGEVERCALVPSWRIKEVVRVG